LRFKPLRTNSLAWLPVLVASIAAVYGADNDKAAFKVRPAPDYPHHQASEKVTIAAQPFESDEQARDAFGKINPWRLGVLPVLVVIQNDSPDSLRVDGMQFYYVLPDRTRIESTPAQELKYIHGARPPKKPVAGPLGGIALGKSPKNPLAEWEIEGRAFAAKMIPPGQSASGFVYFQVAQSSAAASVYISGLANAVSGKELYYFEIPMS
jgi:hypothetical protein